MIRLVRPSIIAMALLSMATTAHACVEFSAPGAELQLEYDPFTPTNTEQSFTVRVQRIDERATAVRFLFSDPDPSAANPVLGIGGPQRYEIEWTRDSGRIVLAMGGEQPNATNGALVAFGAGAGGGARTESFRIRIPAGQQAGAGSFYQPLTVRFQCFAGDNLLNASEMQSDGRVAIDLRVGEMIRAYIGSPGVRRGTLDFGELATTLGKISRTLSVTAQATVPYEIDVQAEHGALARVGGQKPVQTIPYALWLSELPVNDGSRIDCSRTDAPSGRSHLLRVDLDSADSRKVQAGSYSDLITLTFSPRTGLGGAQGCSVSSR